MELTSVARKSGGRTYLTREECMELPSVDRKS